MLENSYQTVDDKRVFSTGATKNISKGKGRYDLIPTEALIAMAKRFEFGVLNGHEENGYRKGIPDSVLYDSAFRHLVQAKSGCIDEDHLGAVMWNVAVLIFNRENRVKDTRMQELYDELVEDMNREYKKEGIDNANN